MVVVAAVVVVLSIQGCCFTFFSLLHRFEELSVSETLIDQDGLNTLTYSVRDYQEMPLYTMISVSLR